jgi:hypothetical protein
VPDTPLPPSPAPPPAVNWLERAALLGGSLALFVLCFFSGFRHHTFPYFYHPDEPGKVEQITSGKFNYHHPMLLLATTRLTTDLLHTPKKSQAIVEVGRGVSAAFMAGAVVMFALLAYLWRGLRAGLVTGAALALHHQIYELAHYMKEDSALLFGVAWTFLAALAYTQRPTLWRVTVLGAGCALAISGKYIGVVVLGVALPVLWVSSRTAGDRRLAHVGTFFGTFIAVLVVVNFSLFVHLVAFSQSFHHEVDLVVKGQGDVTRRVPHALYWNVFIDNSNPVIWLLVVSLITVCYQRWDRLMLPQKLLIWFPFVYGFMLSFSPKENDRYFLPATAVLTTLAAVGAESLPYLLASIYRAWDTRTAQRLLSRDSRRAIMIAASAMLIIVQITGWSSTKPGWSQYDAAFVRDDISALLTWMRRELPADAVVVADSKAGLLNPKRKKNKGRTQGIPQKVIISKLASDLGTVDELRAKGVTHVVISESSYGRFFRSDLRPKDPKKNAQFEAGRQFYEELLRSGELLFEKERGTVIYLHPGIRVYRIQQSAGE